ncbi:MAG: macro domain-containing protein [Pirellulaceae bacterium]|nr:macro domain-containing protein [Pirellulaceae bacterium]
MRIWSQAEQRLELILGDITDQRADVIVNAANPQLASGGGVDGATHRRGGPAIMAETQARYPQGCKTESAVISTAGKLEARFVIHAVGPVWAGENRGEATQLRSAYQSCLTLAEEHQCQSVAFPSLSTGVYRFPVEAACHIAVDTSIAFLLAQPSLKRVVFVLFDRPTLFTFEKALTEIAPSLKD